MKVHTSFYAPMIYMATCVRFLMRAYTLRGQVGEGWAQEIESFLGPVKWHRADRQVSFGPKKLLELPAAFNPQLTRFPPSPATLSVLG